MGHSLSSDPSDCACPLLCVCCSQSPTKKCNNDRISPRRTNLQCNSCTTPRAVYQRSKSPLTSSTWRHPELRGLLPRALPRHLHQSEISLLSTNDGAAQLDRLVSRFQAVASPLRRALQELHATHRALAEGAVADYIPELARADPAWFGISVVTLDGQICEVGDSDRPFTVQSISKPLVYGLALDHHGVDRVLARVGVEPTGDPFNAVMVDEDSRRPHNPMVNAGAIATADMIPGEGATERLRARLETFRRYTRREVLIDGSVFTSERESGHRNRAIAHLMRNFGMISGRIDETLDLYFQQCSVLVTSRDLATTAATLTNGGLNPLTGERAIEAASARMNCLLR